MTEYKLDYFYGSEADQFTFYRTPKCNKQFVRFNATA